MERTEAMAERSDVDTRSTGHSTDEAIIRQRLGALIAALRAKDLDAVGEIYAADVVSFDVEPPLQHVGLAAKLNNWVTVFTLFQELAYEIRELTLAVGADVAFGHGFGRISGTLTNGAATNGMWVRVTFGFQKINGQWLITHDQASVPLDFASGKGMTHLEP
jgi:ketosteroid isomerase-like protein